MPIIQLKLVSTNPPLSAHGRLFREEVNSGKKLLRLVKLEPADIRLTIAITREIELATGQYYFIFNVQHAIDKFEIITSKRRGDGYYPIDEDKFDPKGPYDTFQMVSSFTLTE